MGVIADQLSFLINLLLRKRMIQDGEMPIPDEIQDYLTTLDGKMGMPLMVPRMVSRGLVSNSALFNKTLDEVEFDLNLLFYTARRASTDLLSGFQFNHVQFDNLLRQAMGLRRDINTLLLLNDRTTGMLDYIYEDFNDLSRVDTTLTTAEVDTKHRIVRLGSSGSGQSSGAKILLQDVSISVEATETFEGKGTSFVQYMSIPGSGGPETICNDYLNDFWGAQVKKVTNAPIEWKMTVTLPAEIETSRVQLELKVPKTTYIGLTTLDKDGQGEFKGQLATTDTAEWRFGVRRVKQLVFVFRTDFFKKEDMLFLFYLIVVNLSIYNDQIKGESDFYTKKMPLEFNNRVDRCSLMTTQEGTVEWWVKLWYNESGLTSESSWLAIRPASASTVQGQPVILGALEDVKPHEISLSLDGIRMKSLVPENFYITQQSLKLTAGANLWRVDYQPGSFVQGRYVSGNGSIDLQVAHAGYLPVDDSWSNIDAGRHYDLELFHYFRFSAVIYIDPSTYAEVKKQVIIKTTTPTSGAISRTRYVTPLVQIHSIQAVQQTVTGIDTINLQLERTENPGTSGGYQYRASDVMLHPGINYIVFYIDTGISQATVAEKEALKATPMQISLAVEDMASTGLDYGVWGDDDGEGFRIGSADYVFAAPGDPADVQLYRKVLPYSKLAAKFAYDYKSVAIEEGETSLGVPESYFFLNHPFYTLPPFVSGTFPKPPPSAMESTVACLLSYKKLIREVTDAQVRAHLRKGDILPTIKDFALRFTI